MALSTEDYFKMEMDVRFMGEGLRRAVQENPADTPGLQALDADRLHRAKLAEQTAGFLMGMQGLTEREREGVMASLRAGWKAESARRAQPKKAEAEPDEAAA